MTKMDMKKPGVVLAAEIVGYVMSSCLGLGALIDFDSDSVFAIFAAGGLIAASAFMRRRKEWARIAFTVLSSILILGCLVEINQSGDVADETTTIWLYVCLAMLICAIVFCWLPRANDWFRTVEQLAQPSQLQENKFGKVPNTVPSRKNIVWGRVFWTIIGVSLLAFLFLGDSDEDDQPIEDAVIRYCNSIRNSDEDAWRALVFMDAAGKKGSIADLLKEEPNSEKKRSMEFLINRMYKEQLDLKKLAYERNVCA